jgi:hypothetical protein
VDRPELEREVLKRLTIEKPCDIPIIQRSLRLQPTPALEDILKLMKAAGR